MKAARFHKTGGPEVLIYEDVPDPVPGPGQILLKVEAAGVNYVDIMRRRGDPLHEPTPLPAIVGYEMAGTVAGLGTGVTLPMLGARVFVNARSGAYAQYALAPAESAIEIPAGMDPIKIVALWLQGLTAALALRHAGRIATGETVLVEAAAGGVGTMAVQIAKLYGAGVGFGIHQYYPKPGLIQATINELVDYVVAGRLILQLDHVLPLSEAATAHRLVEERKSTGKVVLLPW
ncbi:MAG: quinone oxidoreductase family protein [Candidatus Binataceae bacterium]